MSTAAAMSSAPTPRMQRQGSARLTLYELEPTNTIKDALLILIPCPSHSKLAAVLQLYPKEA